jgi:hypothetical protein
VESTEALLAAFDAQARTESPSPPAGVWYEHDGPLLRVVGQERGFISAPRDTGARGAELDRLIARQRDYFARRGEAVEWKTYDYDEPADLPARLRAAGFAPEEAETVVVALAADVAAEPVLPPGVVLRQVTADADMRRIAAMESRVWDEDQSWTGEHLTRELAATPDDLIVLTAEAGSQVVSAGWLRFQPGTQFAGLWGGATLSEWRGHGIYRALVARRGQIAAARGVRYLQVDASSDSAPILRRLGFRPIATTTPYVWSPQPRTTDRGAPGARPPGEHRGADQRRSRPKGGEHGDPLAPDRGAPGARPPGEHRGADQRRSRPKGGEHGDPLAPRRQLLQGPGVAVGVGEEHELAPRLHVDLAGLDPTFHELLAGGRDVFDHDLNALLRPGRHVGDPGAEHHRARRPGRGELDEPQALVDLVIVVSVEAHLVDVKGLGPVDIGHRNAHKLDLPVHTPKPTQRAGHSVASCQRRHAVLGPASSKLGGPFPVPANGLVSVGYEGS